MMTDKRTPYREQNPVVSRELEPFFFGKTLEEKVQERLEEILTNQILNLHKRGKEIQEISSFLEIDEKNNCRF